VPAKCASDLRPSSGIGLALSLAMNVHVGARHLISSTLDPHCLPSIERGDAQRDEQRASPPVRGLCRCGHPMSMHCHVDGSGPCAAPDCRCPGQTAG